MWHKRSQSDQSWQFLEAHLKYTAEMARVSAEHGLRPGTPGLLPSASGTHSGASESCCVQGSAPTNFYKDLSVKAGSSSDRCTSHTIAPTNHAPFQQRVTRGCSLVIAVACEFSVVRCLPCSAA